MAVLQGSVGRGGQNLRSDVILVQQLLNQNLPIPLQVLKVDGIVGPRTISTIEEYQRRKVASIRPDGRVDPGGKTFQALTLGVGPQPPGPPPPLPVPPGPAAGAILRFSLAQFRAFSKDLEGELLELNGNANEMKKNYFSTLDTWSADAQLGLMSMAWAMGSAFPTAPPPTGPWPNFTKACKDQDWEGAAKECKMKDAVGTQITRNDRNVILFRNAARIKEGKADPNVLQWPKDLNA
jgi:hypothetical protein